MGKDGRSKRRQRKTQRESDKEETEVKMRGKGWEHPVDVEGWGEEEETEGGEEGGK